MTLFNARITNYKLRIIWSVGLQRYARVKVFAPMTNVCSCNRNLFEMWLEQCLIPQLRPGDVIVIDNASFHHSQTIDEIVAEAGCELWYLPPYSPDLKLDQASVVCPQKLDAAAVERI